MRFKYGVQAKLKQILNLERESKRNPKGKNKIFYLALFANKNKEKTTRNREGERETKRKEKKQRGRGPLITFVLFQRERER